MRGAIHTLVINRQGVQATDAEGRHGASTSQTVTVKGRIMIKTGRERMLIGRFAEDIDAVAVLPTGTLIAAKDQVVVDDVDPALDATYEVMHIVYTPFLLEAYLRIRGH